MYEREILEIRNYLHFTVKYSVNGKEYTVNIDEPEEGYLAVDFVCEDHRIFYSVDNNGNENMTIKIYEPRITINVNDFEAINKFLDEIEKIVNNLA